MASTTLTVTVNGGIPPVSIRVNLLKNGNPLESLNFKKSFTRDFTNLTPGNYSLFIGGVNPISSSTDPSLPKPSTKCELDTTQITLNPPDNTPVTKRGKAYIVQFHFTV